MNTLQTFPLVTPFLWFDNNAQDAVDFYLSVFPNSRRLAALHIPGETNGGVLTVAFELDGQKFTALNGGPLFKFNEAISFVVRCESQQEIDNYWNKLSAGGTPGQCGWLKDKFGLSWQIVPTRLAELLSKPAAMQALMKMTKLDIAELERAREQ